MTEEAEYGELIAKIARERAFGCEHYKETCLRRRISARLRLRGVRGYTEYGALLDVDAREYDVLMDALTINVTRLFRDEAMFAAVTRAVVPELWRSAASPINVWSAGCSTGDEAYSLAILFHRYATDLGDASCATRVRVLGSDIDRTSLIAASRGAFRDTAFTETPPELRRAYFGQSPPHAIIPTVRAMVQFERRDLLTDPFPGDQHVICCRNVLIYFSRATQEAFFPRLHAALAPGGFLILGKVETLFGPAQSLFTAVDRRTRVFRRT